MPSWKSKKKKNAEWQYYNIVSYDEDGKPEVAACRHCKWIGSAHATRLTKHWKKFHQNQASLRNASAASSTTTRQV